MPRKKKEEVKEPEKATVKKFYIKTLIKMSDKSGITREVDEVFEEPDKEIRTQLVKKGLGKEVVVEE